MIKDVVSTSHAEGLSAPQGVELTPTGVVRVCQSNMIRFSSQSETKT